MAIRTYSLSKIYKQKPKLLELDGIWKSVFGNPERSGKMWLIYGEEKNGKTWFSILLAAYLASKEKILYISAEEGLGQSFKEACTRANVDEKNKNFQAYGYVPMDVLSAHLERRYAPKIVFIDNVTRYLDELKNGGVTELMKIHKDKLFIFIAHEDRGEPYTATAKMIKRFADRIIRIVGLAAYEGGRTDGGKFMIDEEKAMLIHGSEIKDNN